VMTAAVGEDAVADGAPKLCGRHGPLSAIAIVLAPDLSVEVAEVAQHLADACAREELAAQVVLLVRAPRSAGQAAERLLREILGVVRDRAQRRCGRLRRSLCAPRSSGSRSRVTPQIVVARRLGRQGTAPRPDGTVDRGCGRGQSWSMISQAMVKSASTAANGTGRSRKSLLALSKVSIAPSWTRRRELVAAEAVVVARPGGGRRPCHRSEHRPRVADQLVAIVVARAGCPGRCWPPSSLPSPALVALAAHQSLSTSSGDAMTRTRSASRRRR
jgi:hypothetical protein